MKKKMKHDKQKILILLKTMIVCMICFFGAMFAIVSFHNDIGIRDVFEEIYILVTGNQKNGVTELEIAYSIGLCLGITIFFNHVFGKRLTNDPTPIEVAMSKYNKDVTDTICEKNSGSKTQN